MTTSSTPAISSPGIGSNLDVNGIVTKLMQVESQPLTDLATKQAGIQSKLSAFGQVSSALSTFQAAMNAASSPDIWQSMKTTVGDSSVLSATAANGAQAGTHTITVNTLAQSQSLESAAFADPNTVVGTGTLTFQFGTYSGGSFSLNSAKAAQTVTIGAGQNTLSGIRDAINNAGIGVTASIINDGTTGNHLVLTTNDTGVANSLKITVSNDDDGNNTDTAGLSALAYDPTQPANAGKNMIQTVAPQDATLTIDGINIDKSSNTITDAIQGMTLNLRGTNAGGSTTLSVAQDTGAVANEVQAFVKAYNDVNTTLRNLTAYNSTTKQGAVLMGNSTVTNLQTQLRSIMTSSLGSVSGNYHMLSDIGISFQKDGTLAVDNTVLNNALSTDFQDVAKLFATSGSATDSQVQYVSSTSSTIAGSYGLSVSQVATHGQSVASQAPGSLTITQGSNDTLNITVDNQTATIPLAAGTYASTAALAAQIQSQINGTSVFSTNGIQVTVSAQSLNAGAYTGLVIASNRYGAASKVNVSGNAAASLMGTPTETAGTDVAGTINDVAASGFGQYLTGASTDQSAGLKVQVTGGAAGARGTINYSQGIAAQLANFVTMTLGPNGPLQGATDGLNSSIKDIQNQITNENNHLDQVQKAYLAQFNALDVLIGQMTSTSNFLTQQLAALPKMNQ